MPVPTVTDARLAAAQALEPGIDDPWNVQDSIVDSVSPPTLIVFWSDPWLEPATTTGLRRACIFTARLSVMCVAGRVEPGAGVATLEELVSAVVGRLDATWPLPTISAPLEWRPRTDSTIAYLSAEVRYRIAVYTTEGA